MTKKSYAELLRDPRWQKKRLEVMGRDDFTCQVCGDRDTTLNVHHKFYSGEPWEINSGFLVTLCQPCHESESEWMKDAPQEFAKAVRSRSFGSKIFIALAEAFEEIDPIHDPQKRTELIERMVLAVKNARS